MKKQIVGFAGAVALFFVGCGGGGGTSISYADPHVIENQDLYRVKLDEVGDYYIQELFEESNSTLYEAKYDMDDNFVPDTNKTTQYSIDGSNILIEYDTAISCKVIESNVSIEFWCLKAGASGALTLYTTRWKSLENAIDNPEE